MHTTTDAREKHFEKRRQKAEAVGNIPIDLLECQMWLKYTRSSPREGAKL